MNRSLAQKARPRRVASRVRVEPLEGRQLLAAFLVTNVADSGAGSLRQALLDNAATPELNTISFAIPGPGVKTISPDSPLPEVNNLAIIDATTQPGYAGTPLIELNGANIFRPGVTPPTQLPNVNGLVLSGGATVVRGLAIDRFTGAGILTTRDGNTIEANFIGTDPTGARSLGNGSDGITVRSRGNTIGGVAAGSRNLISGNLGVGVFLGAVGLQSGNNLIQGNLIGTDLSGTRDVGNGRAGVFAGSSVNTIGGSTASQGNTIAFNGGAGVQVGSFSFDSVTQDRITQNRIFDNFGLGIDLGFDGVTFGRLGGSSFGPNRTQGFPTLTSVVSSGGSTQVEGRLESSPGTSFTVEFFSETQGDPSGFGEGRAFLASRTYQSDATGLGDLATTLPISLPTGQLITATATDSSGNTSEFSRTIGVATSAQANLAVTADESSPSAQAGVARSFRFTVRNNGPSRATNVVATDTLPAGATFLAGTATQGTLDASGGPVVVNLGSLDSGASASFTLTYSVPAPGPAANRVTVAADQADPTPRDNALTQNFQVAPASPVSLDLSGSASAASVRVGDDLTYTFVVRNFSFGNPATRVVLTDALPQGVAFVSARSSQGLVAQDGGVVTADLGPIASGANATVTVVVRPTSPGPLVNTASVAALENDLDVTNNQVTLTTDVAPAPAADLAVIVTGAPQPAVVGQGFTYVVLVGNPGSAPATGVTLTNLLPDAASILSIRPSQGAFAVSGNVLTASLGSIAPGAVAAVTIVLRPGAPGFLVDQASVSADQPDFNIANNYGALATPVLADVAAPAVLTQRLTVSRGAITGIVLTFNKPLDPTLAVAPANYRILDLGRNSSTSASGPAVPIASVTYDPTSRSVRITPRKGLAIGRFYKLVVNGPGAPGLVDTAGNVLDGVANGLQNSVYTALIGRGTSDRPLAVQVGVPAPQPTVGRSRAKTVKAAAVPAPTPGPAKAVRVSQPRPAEAAHKAG